MRSYFISIVEGLVIRIASFALLLCTQFGSQRWADVLVFETSRCVSDSNLRVEGHVPENFPDLLRDAVLVWTNLRAVTLTPIWRYRGSFAEAFASLRQCQELRSLTIWTCWDAESSASLVKLTGLETLTVHQPMGAIARLLPEWLSRLQPTLQGLHLTVS